VMGLALRAETYTHVHTYTYTYTRTHAQGHVEETVENQLLQALIKVKLIKDRAWACYSRCGRTDKGVSALRQACVCVCVCVLWPGLWCRSRCIGSVCVRGGSLG
jgi:tRNA pseudouridine38/39 synthase